MRHWVIGVRRQLATTKGAQETGAGTDHRLTAWEDVDAVGRTPGRWNRRRHRHEP